MSLIQAIILGAVQGLTEFLPISSSGHLVMVQHVMSLSSEAIAVDTWLHVGALGAVVVYFRSELIAVLKSTLLWVRRRDQDENTAIARYLAIASVPAAVAGLLFENLFADAFESLALAGGMLIVTGLMLWFAESLATGERRLSSMSLRDSVWIGIAQMAAILPGISRSGATITAGMWRGVGRADSARFSFLLSIPIIIGATGLSTIRSGLAGVSIPVLLAGILSAGASGLLAIALLMKVLESKRLRLFSVYCFIVGVIALSLALFA